MRGYGFQPLWSFADHGPAGGGEPLEVLLWAGQRRLQHRRRPHRRHPRRAAATAPAPTGQRPGRAVLTRTDAVGATHGFLAWLAGQRLSYSVGFTLPTDFGPLLEKIPERVWAPAYDGDGKVRDGAWVAEVTGLLDLTSWPTGMRVIVRKERPHPGAQLRLTDADGHRITAFATNTRRGHLADLELRHRRRACCEDRIRCAKAPGCAACRCTTSRRTSFGAPSSLSPVSSPPGTDAGPARPPGPPLRTQTPPTPPTLDRRATGYHRRRTVLHLSRPRALGRPAHRGDHHPAGAPRPRLNPATPARPREPDAELSGALLELFAHRIWVRLRFAVSGTRRGGFTTSWLLPRGGMSMVDGELSRVDLGARLDAARSPLPHTQAVGMTGQTGPDAGSPAVIAPAPTESTSAPCAVTAATYAALTDLVLHAPGRAAACNALVILKHMGSAQDVGAALTLGTLITRALGLSADGMPEVRSVTELAQNREVPSPARLYAGALRPLLVARDPSSYADAAAAMWGTDLTMFRRLLERRSPICNDVLKTCLIAAVVPIFDLTPAPVRLAVIDRIMGHAKVVDGDSADATLEFGRDWLLRFRNAAALFGLLTHEIGHIIGDLLVGGRTPQVSALTVDVALQDLEDALPALTDAARRGRPKIPADDQRHRRLSSGLSVMCTRDRVGDGAYTHVSMSDEGGPIDLDVGLALAQRVAELLGGDPMEAVLALSPRGVLHLGVLGLAVSPEPVQRSATADPAAWYSSLKQAGRIGEEESDIPFLLGLASRLTIVYDGISGSSWSELNACAQIRATDLTGVAPGALKEMLCIAVRCGDPIALRRVLASGADPADVELAGLGVSGCVVRNDKQVVYLGPTTDSLFAVLEELRTAGVRLGAPVTEDGQTLLTDAAGRDPQLTARLVRCGADVDQHNADGETAVAVAVRLRQPEAVRALVDAGASTDIRDRDGLTPLHQAARSGDADLAVLLLAEDADVDARLASGDTPLMLACSAEVATTLLAAGSEVEARSQAGYTPLSNAAGRGDVEVVRCLLAAGANPQSTTDLGRSALHVAVSATRPEGSVELLAALLDAGADIDE
ncbi:MAG: hypothetical protein QOF58_1180, partial [Pseudonocardiales bacterium]|nr:hypothetical protein [Pseudonocardiales bacterium]